MSEAYGFLVGSWAAMSVGERQAPRPDWAMISRRSSSSTDLSTMGRTEALASCLANRLASSSETWVGVIFHSSIDSGDED
ncbi:unnamed protein product [Linum trigynum]|uniref:Uncharacterized protein n=1 Tax=Linum trigynum TaxID=586398 RepID=A0AAV2EBH3_9ROSI